MPISGAAIESLFDYEIMSRGFTVSAPRSDTSPYDRVVDTKTRLYRVQIKGRRAYGKKSLVVKIAKSDSTAYTIKDTDIVALFIEDTNAWYIFPVAECKRLVRINMNGGVKEKYKNNWQVFL
jgi:hypothetical protein